ncbi:MAG TPA: hypothetical protein VL117_05660 [Thermoleophilia bacterium]|nr:hypothetical protein [Thermoleophilia bacterium]
MPKGRLRHVLLLSVALAAAASCLTAPAAHAVVGPAQIDGYLLAHGSPLAGEGQTFYQAARRNGVDPAFLVAISGAESSFGQFLFAVGPQTATYNAFNWFYAPTRAGSAFTSWDQAIDAVAAGLRGPLYYGAGRYSVGAIAPVYCPQGTRAWIDNVTTYMLELGADPNDTRWRGTPLTGGRAATGDRLRAGRTGAASALVVRRPISLSPAVASAGGRVRILFTLTNEGLQSGRWRAVILRLQGPTGQDLAFGRMSTLRLAPGASYSFATTTRLRAAGAWRGWVDVEAEDGTMLTAAHPVVHIVVGRGVTKRRRPA